jgi:hypothetical protein
MPEKQKTTRKLRTILSADVMAHKSGELNNNIEKEIIEREEW